MSKYYYPSSPVFIFKYEEKNNRRDGSLDEKEHICIWRWPRISIQLDGQRHPMEFSKRLRLIRKNRNEAKSRKFRQNTMCQNQSNRFWHIVFWRNFSKLRFDFGFSLNNCQFWHIAFWRNFLLLGSSAFILFTRIFRFPIICLI